MTIGERIKQRRLELDLSADDLAFELGKSRATIYRYENGDIKNMPTTILEPLADALKTTPAYLMGWTADPNDWEQIANDEGICPSNDYDGDPEDWYQMKIRDTNEHQQEESELIEKVISDDYFIQLASSYIQLHPENKEKVIHYTDKLLDIQLLEDNSNRITNIQSRSKSHLDPIAAHERTDIEVTDEMREHDDDIMNDDDFWKDK